MGLNIPRPFRNFRNEGLRNTRPRRNTKCVWRSLKKETYFKRLFVLLAWKLNKVKQNSTEKQVLNIFLTYKLSAF
jgi:hypothetical protein